MFDPFLCACVFYTFIASLIIISFFLVLFFAPLTFLQVDFSLWPVLKRYPCSLRTDSTRPHILLGHPPSTSHPPTSFIHVSIRTCHSLSVRPFISPDHRFSLNGWVPSPWHFGHHMSTLPSLYHWPFVRSNWTDSRGASAPLFASHSACVAFLHCYHITLGSKHALLNCCKYTQKDTSHSAITQ